MGSKILYQNIIENALTTLAVTDESSGNVIENIADKKLYTKWQAASSGTKVITITLNNEQDADCIAFAGHNFNGMEYTLEYDSGGGVFVEADSDTIATGKCYMKQFNSQTSDVWKLTIAGGAATPECAVIYLGTLIELDSYPEAPYAPYKESIIAEKSDSKGGNFLGAVIRSHQVSAQATFKWIVSTTAANKIAPFWEYAKYLKPFFFAWALEASDEILFVNLKKESEFSLPRSNGDWIDSITLDMEGIR